MPSQPPGQLAYETIAHGPAARAFRAEEAIAAATLESGLTGDRWMLRLVYAGVTALACLALGRHSFSPAAWVLTSIGVSLATFAGREWRGSRRGAIALGIAAHLVGWAVSVQIGARVEWGAIFFVISTTQLRYEAASAILPSIGFYLTQHLAQFLLLQSGVSLDFIWHGNFDGTTSLLAVLLAVLQGTVLVETARSLTRRHEAAIHANFELSDRATQANAQAAALLRTDAILRTTRQQLVEAIEAIDAGFALFDADDRVIQVNSAYRDYYKEIEEQFAPGTPYVDIARAYLTVFPEYTAGLPLDEAVQSWVAARGERANTKEYKQGDRWLLLQDRPTASGGRVSLRTDISNLKRIQRELEEARSKAEEANRAKSGFLARMSHELRTPLNAIIGFSRLVKSNKHGVLTEKDVNYLDRVSSNGEHLLALINDMLDLSRIEAGKMPVVIEEIDCNAMIVETVRMLDSQSAHDAVRVVAHSSPRQLNLSTDASKLRQVLINLIGNALKFTAQGTVTVSVHVGTERPGDIVFAVSDTGIGIPSDRLSAIFDAFEQADGTTSRQYGGTGLGLTISRTLCSLISATLTVESTVGVGSTFRVTCAPLVRRATPLMSRAGVGPVSQRSAVVTQ